MNKELVVFGSSSSEIFDYIFGDNPHYYSFWASGWSARGLTNKIDSAMKPYEPHLSKISKDANILLCFGDVDLDFNLPYKIHYQKFYDFPNFLEEMKVGILAFKNYLNKIGFFNVYVILPIAPIVLPDEYWKYPPLPPKTRGKLYLSFIDKLSDIIPVVNCFHSLIESIDNPICSSSFLRKKNDHHVDYIKAQDVVYSSLLSIDGMLKPREPKHIELYPHIAYGIHEVLEKGKPRPRTCK